jgi:GTP cyclohydrolase I
VRLAELEPNGMVAGHVDGHPVLIARVGEELLAIGGQCTHYGAPLADGLVVGDTVRCPWHHACFSLRTGEAVGAPALRPVWRYEVERRGDVARVTKAFRPDEPGRREPAAAPASVVIVGGGPAADAAADMLRRRGYAGPVTMVSDDDAPPVDRPNLSKDYLAGNAPEEWIPLRADDFYAQHDIDLKRGRRAVALDPARREVRLDDGSTLAYGALLLATGAAPARLPASVDPHGRALYLRTLADSRALIAAAERAQTAVVLGASFIGLEVAASLRARGLEVHVAAPEARPLERVLGAELGDFVRELHRAQGVNFHLGRTAKSIEPDAVVLDDGTRLAADVVVAGIGVKPREELATAAGLETNRGIVVDGQLRTPRATCSARARRSRRCRSSGAGTTTARSSTSATPSGGTRSRSRETRRAATARCGTARTGACSRWPRSAATARPWRPKRPWRRSRMSQPASVLELPIGRGDTAQSADAEDELEALVRRQLALLGEDPDRAGLLRTPERVAKSMAWLTGGYEMDARDVIGEGVFEEAHESMVLVRDIELYSLCEHHVLPFFGKAHVAYVPNGRIVGLSKIPRIVDVFARRLQVQERLTEQIAQAIEDALAPAGVGVVIEARHLCMMMRGVEKQNSSTITSALRGRFRDCPMTRHEFLRLAHRSE